MKYPLEVLMQVCPDECIDWYNHLGFDTCICGEIPDIIKIEIALLKQQYDFIEQYDALEMLENYLQLQHNI